MRNWRSCLDYLTISSWRFQFQYSKYCMNSVRFMMFYDVSSILFCFFKACTCFPTISTLEHPKTTSTKYIQVPSTTLSVTSPRWAEPSDHCVSLWANGLDLNLSHHPHHPHWRGFKPWWSWSSQNWPAFVTVLSFMLPATSVISFSRNPVTKSWNGSTTEEKRHPAITRPPFP